MKVSSSLFVTLKLAKVEWKQAEILSVHEKNQKGIIVMGLLA